MNEGNVSVKKTGVKTGKLGIFMAIGVAVESALLVQFPIAATLPPGTISGAVATVCYGAYDIIKRKWLS